MTGRSKRRNLCRTPLHFTSTTCQFHRTIAGIFFNSESEPTSSTTAWLNGSDPQDLLRPYPSELMTMWPVSTRVNSPKNDDASLFERVAQEGEARGGSEVKRANEAPDQEPANSE